jgi:hypothetical protein
VKKRRSASALQQELERAETKRGKAAAHYDLALFHDNNGREAIAIPHYQNAIEHGLDQITKAEALAWLASSLYKPGTPEDSLERLNETTTITVDPSLMVFLKDLERRVRRALYEKT